MELISLEDMKKCLEDIGCHQDQIRDFMQYIENKETQKMYHKPIDINVTCVRVPVLRGHSESIYIETAKPIDLATAKDLLAHSTGVELMDDISHQIYPMPILNVGSPTVYVGRVRKDLNKENALSLWVVADQLMKGAAYNSIDIGLKMIEMNLL